MARLANTRQARSLLAATAILALAIADRTAPAVTHAQVSRELVPVAASSLARRPDVFYGSRVALSATVEAILSPTTFVVDQDGTRSTGQDVLVIAPTLVAPPETNAYLTIIGEAFQFDPAALAEKARDYRVDLAPDVLARYTGRPAVLATVVLTSEIVDLAKVPESPLTPEEQAFDQTMKEVSAAFPALRTAIDTANQDVIEEYATVLRESFAEAEAFFKARGTADATGWSAEARKLVQSISEAAAASRWGDAATSAASLGQLCQRCHGVHRERTDDGGYRVKRGR
ncbi:MAG TPA: hypothetical protein VMM93_08745 [Vicinamibacterales bacterium]|nr:hypothetical protein [Vicinamibacterales bacterium]